MEFFVSVICYISTMVVRNFWIVLIGHARWFAYGDIDYIYYSNMICTTHCIEILFLRSGSLCDGLVMAKVWLTLTL